MKNNGIISLFVILIISLGYSCNISAEIKLTTIPVYSQSIGMLVRLRPTFDLPEQNQEFKYLLFGASGNGSNSILRDWGGASFDWNTSGLEPGNYYIKVIARSLDDPNNKIEFDYKRYELVSHSPVSSLRMVMNPRREQAIGNEVTLAAIAKVGEEFANSSNDMELQYRFYLVLPDGVSSEFLSEWRDIRAVQWDTTGYQQGVYQLGVQVRRRDSGVQTFEYTSESQYTLSNSIAISSIELSTDGNESPQTVGSMVELNASTQISSDMAIPEYLFRIRSTQQRSFDKLCGWSVETRCIWNTEDYLQGKYIIEVHARQQGIDTATAITKTIGFWLNDLKFENVTVAAGLEHIGESWGGAWGDVNNDGLPDIWITNHRQSPSLYFNNGDGTFDDVTNERLLTKWRTDAHGTEWSDFDNDGDQDLIQTAGGSSNSVGSKNLLYINRDGYLINESDQRGVSYPELRGRGATWLDWNKDGKLDLFLTGHSPINDQGNRLFIQQDGGIFYDQSSIYLIPVNQPGWVALPTRVSNRDYALLVSYVNFPVAIHPEENSSEYLDVVGRYRNVYDISANDFNGDSTIDIFLSRKTPKGQSYAVNTDGLMFWGGTVRKNVDNGLSFRTSGMVTFNLFLPGMLPEGVHIGGSGLSIEDFETATIMDRLSCIIILNPEDQRVWGLSEQRSQDPYGAYIGYDPELDRWTIISNNKSHIKYKTIGSLISSESAIVNIEEINFDPPIISADDILLLRNEMNEFVESEGSFPLGTNSVSAVTGDFDNDMDVDVYTIQTSILNNQPNIMYINTGNGSFQVLPVNNHMAGGSDEGNGDTVIMADYDVDGFLDLLVFNGDGTSPAPFGPRQLFRNLGNKNNWIEIDLHGTESNRDGIESVIYAYTPDGKTQIRERNGGVHFKGQDHKRTHFGLGKNRGVDIVIHWPSGIVQTVQNIASNQVIEIVESGTQNNSQSSQQ